MTVVPCRPPFRAGPPRAEGPLMTRLAWAATLLTLVAGLAAPSPCESRPIGWERAPGLEEISFVGSQEVTSDVRGGAAYVVLARPTTLGGVSYDGLIVGEGFVHLLQVPAGGIPPPPSEDRPPVARPALGPRIELFSGAGVQVGPSGRVLLAT